MTSPGSILGTRVLRTEDPLFLTRGAVYTDDVVDESLTGAVWVTFVRSHVAHARIVSIDCTAASQSPGFVAAFTGADLGLPDRAPMWPTVPLGMSRPILARDTVRFVGEAVVAVVTTELYQGEDAAELVEVEYEPLPAVVDPRVAAAGGVLLFPDAGTNIACTFEPPSRDEHLFDDCEVVVTREIVNQRIAPAPMETRAAAAVWGADGRLTSWIPNQGAQGAKADFATMLDVPPELIRVVTPDVGGAFGAKFGADAEHAAVAFVARALGRPARWTENRYDNLLAMTHGRAQVQTVTIGGSRQGRVSAYRLEILQDCGAYPAIGSLLPSLTRLMAPGTYDIAKVESAARSVVTTTTPVGAYRGAGRPEATAAIERAMDLFAAEIGMDPAEVRRLNLLAPFDNPHQNGQGALYDSGDYGAALELALEAADYRALRIEQLRRRDQHDIRQLGIGLACYVEITGAGLEAGAPHENAQVEVHADGTATILTGTSPHGQGHGTAWAMLASDELGIAIDKITVMHGDTDLIPEGGGTGGSRSLQQGGAAVRQASQELVELAMDRASEILEVDRADLELDRARASIMVRGAPEAVVSLADLAGKKRLFIRSVFSAAGPTFPFGAHVAVVEVDVETGKADLLRLIAVDDAGVILNPLLADGQRHGGIAQGVAQTLYEEMVYDDDGNPLTATFADYPFPSAAEMPMFELVTMETPTSYNSLGAKGIGEAGTIGATPAVQNAVIDAVAHLGVRHVDMPTTSRRIWRAISDAAADGAIS
ncbi:carbon-monoxide dehydrogenase large subunit [Nakamurella sp. UYEF19]|uniref:xanthine dehydrogenase family protein molybdopterin-binding subunit n=1 Tax=Nakamurella sp. UYEF19 TaxID=1756392 RepID=UPI003392B318